MKSIWIILETGVPLTIFHCNPSTNGKTHLRNEEIAAINLAPLNRSSFETWVPKEERHLGAREWPSVEATQVVAIFGDQLGVRMMP